MDGAPVVIRPRVAPRDAKDALFAAGVCVLQLAVLLGVPFVVAGLVFQSERAAQIAAGCANLCIFLFSVRRLEVSAEGIRFVRVLGSPKLLAWDRVRSISVAPRRELILHGWLWPLFPARELTICFSSREHLRFDYDGGYRYFPPADLAAAQATLDELRRPRAVS